MRIPDNLDLYEAYEREMEDKPKVIYDCDVCAGPIYEGQDYYRIDAWDKCVCADCADDIGVWDVAEDE